MTIDYDEHSQQKLSILIQKNCSGSVPYEHFKNIKFSTVFNDLNQIHHNEN